MTKTAILAIAVTGALFNGAAHAEGADVENGELAFHRNCAACHSLEKGENKIGPSLFAIYGRPSARVETYGYSTSLRKLELSWTDANLDAYITDSQTFAPGAKMWLRLPDAKVRRDIIAFLRAQATSTGK